MLVPVRVDWDTLRARVREPRHMGVCVHVRAEKKSRPRKVASCLVGPAEG